MGSHKYIGGYLSSECFRGERGLNAWLGACLEEVLLKGTRLAVVMDFWFTQISLIAQIILY